MDSTPSLFEVVSPNSSDEVALAALEPAVRAWFVQRFGQPTAAQRLAWPPIVAGKNLLLSAPTGMGKTLAAFLPVLGELLALPLSRSVRCLYIAPLKALGNDARKTLRATLAGLTPFLAEGTLFPQVALRTGDTPASQRRRLWENPPEILLTTPESLAVLLSQPAARDLFSDLRWVILDEVHALAACKRGADLAISLERLAAIVGEGRAPERRLQRIGLSATCTPLTEAQRYLVGAGRSCTLARVEDRSALELIVAPLHGSQRFLTQLLDRLGPEIQTNRSTLIFTNTRSLAERVSWGLRRRFPAWHHEIAVHHSALAAERRRRVERQFKRGQLRAVVCSTSLELGIDIGTVDGVVLVHPPGGVVRLLQRVGRAGHGPGRIRRGLILTGSTPELLEAAVTAASSRAGQQESLRLARGPLDVLCQQLLGMAAAEPWTADDAFTLIRRSYPFGDLSRRDFDDVLTYLSGGSRVAEEQWLPPRLRWLEDHFTIRDDRTARLLRRNLGTILTEEPWSVRLVRPPEPTASTASDCATESKTQLIGQVEEAFAERLQPGDRFLLDGRCLEFRRLERQGAEVFLVVDEVPGRPQVPRWTGDGLPLSGELARRLYLLRSQAAEMLREGTPALARLLERDYELSGEALVDLVHYFEQQESYSEIPDPQTLLIEAVRAQEGADYYLHTPLSRIANDALARVVVARLVRRRGTRVISIVADLGFALVLRGTADLTPEDFRELLRADGFAEDLDRVLLESQTLRERFQRVALTGLMLLRNPIGQKRRVGGKNWGERRLFEQVRAAHPDFVLLRQAEREVRDLVCDAVAAHEWVAELPMRTIRCRWLGRPSPFAQGWTQSVLDVTEPHESAEEALRRLHARLMNFPE